MSKEDEIGFTNGPSYICFETVNRRYRRVGIALRLALLIGCTLLDWRLGLGAFLMGVDTLIEWAVLKEPWKPKPPRYIFDHSIDDGGWLTDRPDAVFTPPRDPEDGVV